MRRLIWGRTFLRAYKRQLRKHPELADTLADILLIDIGTHNEVY